MESMIKKVNLTQHSGYDTVLKTALNSNYINKRNKRKAQAKRKQKVIFYIMITALSLILFIVARQNAVAFRHSNSFGGEFLILMLPFVVHTIIDNIKGTLKSWKTLK